MDDCTGRLHPRFPAADFFSRTEFENNARRTAFQERDLDAYEQRLATDGAPVARAGTCAACLRACVFTSTVDAPPPGRLAVPQWRRQQLCDCTEPLDASERALLHFLQARVGMSAWTSLAVLAAPSTLQARLSGLASIVDKPGSAHIAIAHDMPTAAPDFAAMREHLVVGGTLAFTAPFDPAAIGSTPRALGWDFVERLRGAGFRRAAAHCYRSEELGYIGASNYIFSAQAA